MKKNKSNKDENIYKADIVNDIDINEYKYPCDNCGMCCRNLDLSHIYDDLHDGTGICKYLNINTNLCTIYTRRPEKCNIIKSYKYFKDILSFDTYIEINLKECKKLKDEN